MIGWKDKQEDFLAKAKDAEERAVVSADSELRKIWLQVAKDYRELARLIENHKL
jgi:hypothetical protein